MTIKEKKIILIVHTKISDDEINLIRKLGYSIAYIAENISMDEIIKIDYPFEDNINTIQSTEEVINKTIDKFNIERIFTMNEYYIELVAEIAEKFNIRYWGINKEAANRCRNKKESKRIFEEYNIPNAKYMLLKSPKEALSILREMAFPLVIKPSNESGSKLVFVCKNIQEMIDCVSKIYDAIDRSRGNKIDNEVLVEEYLEGNEYSVETYTIDGVSKILAITSKETDNCIEISHTVPANLDSRIVGDIKRTVMNALKALDVRYGVTHTELKITKNGVKIIEINGRPAGDNIHKLVESVTGINLRALSLIIALEGNVNNLPELVPYAKSATVQYFISDKDGIVNYNFINQIESNEIELDLYYENGQSVKKTTDNFSRLGYFIVYSNESEYSKDKAKKMISMLDVSVK